MDKLDRFAQETKTTVPFADLKAQYISLKDEIDTAIADVIERSAFVRGNYVSSFMVDFAAAIGTQHCVSCANGTDALYISMRSLGVRPGDEVITTAHSWISTSETITQAGGKVVFCDIDDKSYTIDPEQIEEAITDRTVGIVPVHLYGQAADMDAIVDISKRHGLWIIEDCAQAHLATFNDRQVGTFGASGTFSFYPGKNLGAMGDAGAIVTNDDDLAQRMTMFANHGGLIKGDHEIEGINSRLDGLQAAVLSVKLKHLPQWTARRQEIAAFYSKALDGVIPDLQLPETLPGRKHVYHLYVVRHPERDRLKAHLQEQGIQTNINYPTALPFLKAYRYLNHSSEDFPNAWKHQSHILSLPLYPEMTEEHLAQVVDSVCSFR